MHYVYEELGETSRRQILAELRSGPKNVSDLCVSTGLKQPNVSNHLARMRTRGIVRASRMGRQVYYSFGSPEIEGIVRTVLNSPDRVATVIDFETLSREYARQAVQGDETACGEILDQVFRVNASLLEIYERLLTPAMVLVGNWWKVEAIDEGQEHMATAITERMMARASHITGPMRRVGKTVLLGCAAGSHHTVGIRMICDFLRMRGWRTLFLGGNVPTRSFVANVQAHRPDLVLISCNSEAGLEGTIELLQMLSEFRQRKRMFPVGIGGCIAAEYGPRYREAGADFVCESLRAFTTDILPDFEGPERVRLSDRELIHDN
ncbi:metalloregulator ArsR/SmtB family transcription factor [bacterium]|nr:MAG: metalloregulator ArsR/SmtB family transcription factor [bacterium]